MFKLIKVDFYDEFSCMMSDCPDNCCDEDWDIYIDDDAIEKYRQLGVPDLFAKITPDEPHKLIKKDHKCPFITPEGLCFFHRDYGEDFLPNTCRSYPRFASTYGDVYLETLGMSCPAVVMQVLGLYEPVVFPEKIYYEEQSEIGKIPEQSAAEKAARSLIARYAPGSDVLETYMKLYGDLSGGAKPGIKKRHEMLAILKERTASTPSEKYVSELFDDDSITFADKDEDPVRAEGLKAVEDEMDRISPCFSCNVNRMLLFEHLMLDSQNDMADTKKTVRRGLIIWILLLMSLDVLKNKDRIIDEAAIVECTYKIMRILDHGGDVLSYL